MNERDDLRIGDSERNEMAELLSRHFSEGRLDEAEFHERVSRAMSAKTRGDLRGLLSDLPSLGLPGATVTASGLPVPPRQRRVMRSLVLVVGAVVVLGAIGSSFPPLHIPGLLVIAIVVLLVLKTRRGRHWHRHGFAHYGHYGHDQHHDTYV